VALDLPDFPWDSLTGYAETARAHPGGIVDLSVGSPVDPTPDVVREALVASTDAHAYPQVAGTPALRAAIAEWYERRRGVAGLTDAEVLPTIGSKELIAGMALWLGIGRGDTIVYPRAAYPTYALGAALVGADSLASDDPAEWPESTRLVWLNSPGNPDGSVLDVEQLRAAVARARELGAVVAGDECYAELGWEGEWADRPTPCVLDPRVVGDDRRGVVSVYSLSKQSNLAGYRAGFVAGDADVVAQLLAVRKHAGLMPPAPAGFRVDHSEAGLYLWVTRDEDAWQSVAWLAERGVLVAPGSFYGVDGGRHVRVALTTTDERIAAAVERLRG